MESFPFECITCQLSITGITNFQRHVSSIEHANRVQAIASNNVTDEDKVLTSAEEPTSTNNQCSPFSANLLPLECDLCQKRFSGNSPYQQHLASAAHIKKVEGLVNPNSAMGILRCNTCDKNFSGRAPYEQHIVSKAHLKKSALSDMEQNSFPAFLAEHQSQPLISKVNENSKNNDTLNSSEKRIRTEGTTCAPVVASSLQFNCNICDKMFTGKVPYQQHMDSQVHKKKVQEKEMLKKYQSSSLKMEINPTGSSDEMDGIVNKDIGTSSLRNDFMQSPLPSTSQVHPYRCADCDKNFTGHVPYDQHMQSTVHLKKMLQKKPINGETNLTSTPKCEVPNSERYYCKMCNKQCTGATPFLQHKMSEAHCKTEQVFKYNQELNNLSKLKDSGIDEDQMSIDDNGQNELSKKSNSLFNSMELSFGDILKEVNQFTPETLDVTIVGVGDEIVL